LGAELTGHSLPNGRKVLLQWVPDPSVERNVAWSLKTFQRLFHLVAFSVNVLEKAVNDLGTGNLGSQTFDTTESEKVATVKSKKSE
jgi:hypothetical protein